MNSPLSSMSALPAAIAIRDGIMDQVGFIDPG
jgi:hypothetical protein